MTEPGYVREAREFYDAIAVEYNEMFPSGPEGNPLDRAVLETFAARVRDDGGGPVVEAGSGPGRVCAYFTALGTDITGVDVSPHTVKLARARFPELRFETGTMTALERADGSLAGLLSWYSLIHVPPARHPEVLAEFHRVLRPGGRLLLGFQVGTVPNHHERPFGHDVRLDFHRLSPDRTADLLAAAGFDVEVKLVRAAHGEQEKTPQGFLLARKATP
ncbi:hypothetical protein SRB5_42070 [Streptomyces sp. RB5]|uniref:Methyltransferase domain-containing protein n=1 Tax=Streptomyces smaragdinus TaxID=2585196 RepID=A0A7K0CKN4_9ACTN|nr:class I SAM-dependent methyltransferase [Streptomyces smaragdinus]MQY14046.1 hypothetical protein [Streptomyces smaragdinus]